MPTAVSANAPKFVSFLKRLQNNKHQQGTTTGTTGASNGKRQKIPAAVDIENAAACASDGGLSSSRNDQPAPLRPIISASVLAPVVAPSFGNKVSEESCLFSLSQSALSAAIAESGSDALFGKGKGKAKGNGSTSSTSYTGDQVQGKGRKGRRGRKGDDADLRQYTVQRSGGSAVSTLGDYFMLKGLDEAKTVTPDETAPTDGYYQYRGKGNNDYGGKGKGKKGKYY
jgi:hypothetical protein